MLVQTGKRNYTAKDALQLLKDLELTQQASTFMCMDILCAAEISLYRSLCADMHACSIVNLCSMQAAVYPIVHNLTYPLPKVDFKIFCMYGMGMDTDEGYVYDVDAFDGSAPDAPKKVLKGDGDGTVNARSLEACKRCVLQHALLDTVMHLLVPCPELQREATCSW